MLCAVCMIITSAPLNVFAEEVTGVEAPATVTGTAQNAETEGQRQGVGPDGVAVINAGVMDDDAQPAETDADSQEQGNAEEAQSNASGTEGQAADPAVGAESDPEESDGNTPDESDDGDRADDKEQPVEQQEEQPGEADEPKEEEGQSDESAQAVREPDLIMQVGETKKRAITEAGQEYVIRLQVAKAGDVRITVTDLAVNMTVAKESNKDAKTGYRWDEREKTLDIVHAFPEAGSYLLTLSARYEGATGEFTVSAEAVEAQSEAESETKSVTPSAVPSDEGEVTVPDSSSDAADDIKNDDQQDAIVKEETEPKTDEAEGEKASYTETVETESEKTSVTGTANVNEETELKDEETEVGKSSITGTADSQEKTEDKAEISQTGSVGQLTFVNEQGETEAVPVVLQAQNEVPDSIQKIMAGKLALNTTNASGTASIQKTEEPAADLFLSKGQLRGTVTTLNSKNDTSAVLSQPKTDKTPVTEETETRQMQATGYRLVQINPQHQDGSAFSEEESHAVTGKVTLSNLSISISEGVDVPEGASIKGVVEGSFKLYHIQGESATEITDAQITYADGKITGIEFETTEGLSPFAVVYTVDFEYTDAETGETYAFSIQGNQAQKIADIIAANNLPISGDITNADLVNTNGENDAEALRVYEQEDGWYIESSKAFTDTYRLTLTVDGKDYMLMVTDGIYDSGVTISFCDLNDNKINESVGSGYNIVGEITDESGNVYWKHLSISNLQSDYTFESTDNFVYPETYTEMKLSAATSFKYYIIKGTINWVGDIKKINLEEQDIKRGGKIDYFTIENKNGFTIVLSTPAPYTITLVTNDGSEADLGSDYRIYAKITRDGQQYTPDIDENELKVTTVPAGGITVSPTFFKQNENNKIVYQAGDDIVVGLKDSSNNEKTTGAIINGYKLSVTANASGAIIELTEMPKFTVTVATDDLSDSVDKTKLFMYAKVTRDNNTYYAVSDVAIGTKATFSFSTLKKGGGENDKINYDPAIDTDVVVGLVMNDSKPNEWEVPNKPIYGNEQMLDGKIVTVTPGTNSAAITFAEPEPFMLTVEFQDENGDVDTSVNLNDYYLYLNVNKDGDRYYLSTYTISITNGTYTTEEITAFTDANGENPVGPYEKEWSVSKFALIAFKDGKDHIINNCGDQNNSDGYGIGRTEKLNGYVVVTPGSLPKLVFKRPAPYTVTVKAVDDSNNPTATTVGGDYYVYAKYEKDGNPYYGISAEPVQEIGTDGVVAKITTFYGNSGAQIYSPDVTINEIGLVQVPSSELTKSDSEIAQYLKDTAVKINTVGDKVGEAAEVVSINNANKEITLKVSGEQFVSVIRYYSMDSTVKDIGNDEKRIDNGTLEAPSLTKKYYLLATLNDTVEGTKTVVGYAIKPADVNGKASTAIAFTEFISTDGSNTPITYSSTATYTVATRLYYYEGNDTPSIPSYADITDKTKYSEDPETGYEFVANYDASAGKNIIEIKKATPKQYGIKVTMDEPGLEIPAGEYVALVKVKHKTGPDTLAFLPLSVEGNNKTFTVEAFYSGTYPENNVPVSTIWHNSSSGDWSSERFTGNEKSVEILYLLTQKAPGQPDVSYGMISEMQKDNPPYILIKSGDSINGYTISFPAGLTPAEINGEDYLLSEIHFDKDHGTISKSYIDELLEKATDFGLYTGELKGHTGDMEANIGAARVTGAVDGDYGYSGNNINVNNIYVSKKYVDDQGRGVKTTVTLGLFKWDADQNTYTAAAFSYQSPGSDGTGSGGTTTHTVSIDYSEINRQTDDDGILTLEFNMLPPGLYTIMEKLDGKWYSYGESGTYTVDDDVFGNGEKKSVTVTFMDKELLIANTNKNINYFGAVDGLNATQEEALLRHSRNGYIYIADSDDYERIKATYTTNGQLATILKPGDTTYPETYYPVLDIETDLDRLADLSASLATATSSETVRIITLKASEIGDTNITLKSDGRYIVLNIIMDNGDKLNPEIYLDGVQLTADFGHNGDEYASKVLYNILNVNKEPYTGVVNTSKMGVGVMLAPSAEVDNLGGLWGGTIIAGKAKHSGNEIHSDNANKIINKSTMLTNSFGQQETGDLEITKAVVGTKNKTTDFKFQITLTDKNDNQITGTKKYAVAGIPRVGVLTFINGETTVTMRADGRIRITGIPTDYHYTVKEITTAATANYTVVGDAVRSGEIKTITGRVTTVPYTNTYKTEDTGIKLTGTKSYEGGTLTDGKFTFTVKSGTVIVATGVSKADGSIEFSEIKYTQADMGEESVKTFTYEVQEFVPSGADESNGFTLNGTKYDNSVKTVKVEVKDNSGKLEAQVVSGADEIAFKNTYSAEGEIELGVKKSFVGRAWKETDKFTFTLSENGSVKETVTISAAGEVKTFTAIKYTQTGVYTYVVEEVAPAKDEKGITYDRTPKTITVEVTDNTDGTLSAEVIDGAATAEAKNTYSAAAVDTEVMITKVFTGREWNDTDVFTFTLAAIGGQGGVTMPEVKVKAATKDEKTVTFGKITFTKAGTYNYTITEKEGSIPGVAYDTEAKTLTIIVEDNGEGALVVKTGSVQNVEAKNTYSAAATEIALKVEKELTGRDWLDGDVFTFSR